MLSNGVAMRTCLRDSRLCGNHCRDKRPRGANFPGIRLRDNRPRDYHLRDNHPRDVYLRDNHPRDYRFRVSRRRTGVNNARGVRRRGLRNRQRLAVVGPIAAP